MLFNIFFKLVNDKFLETVKGDETDESYNEIMRELQKDKLRVELASQKINFEFMSVDPLLFLTINGKIYKEEKTCVIFRLVKGLWYGP